MLAFVIQVAKTQTIKTHMKTQMWKWIPDLLVPRVEYDSAA